MAKVWWYRLGNSSLTEEELKTISNPKLELRARDTLRCVQVLGAFSTLVVGPIAAIKYRRYSGFRGSVMMASIFGVGGVLAGTALGPIISYGRMRSKNADNEAYYDQCYKLRLDENLLQADRASISGLLLGLILFPTIFNSGRLYGALFGMSLGVVLSEIYKK